jgi:hypothetical protein
MSKAAGALLLKFHPRASGATGVIGDGQNDAINPEFLVLHQSIAVI